MEQSRWDVFEQHLAKDRGEAEPDEQEGAEARLAQWVKAGGVVAEKVPDTGRAFQQLQVRLGQQHVVPGEIANPLQGRQLHPRISSTMDHRSSRSRPGRMIRMAGALVAACGLLVMGWMFKTRGPLAREAQVYTTLRAQYTRVTLPDGSDAVLAPESELRYTTSVQGARTVALRGEAYFTVTPQPERPFVVFTGNVRTHVLGTEFAVRRYDDASVTTVVVVSGKVAAGSEAMHRQAPVTLTAGMAGMLTDSTANVSTVRDVRAATDWTRGRLVFTDTPIPQLLETLGRWYGYQFRLADSVLARRHVSTVLSIHEPQEAMQMLREVLDVTMTFNDSVVTLHTNRGRPAGAGAQSAPARRDVPKHSPLVGVGK